MALESQLDPATANPKDLVGCKKIQVGLYPAAAKLYGAMALEDGAKKYGPYNWREKNITYTTYLDAMERHLLALRDREDYADDSKLHHLCHILGCAGILADAIENGNLIDDRPPKGPAAQIIAKAKKS